MTDRNHREKSYTRTRKKSNEEIDDQISELTDSFCNFLFEEVDRVCSFDESMVGYLEEYICPIDKPKTVYTLIDTNENESSKVVSWLYFICPIIFTALLIIIGICLRKKN